MARTLAVVLLIPALALAAACGSGDKNATVSPAPTSAAAATAVASAPTSAPASDNATGNIFSTVLGSALNGGGGDAAAEPASDPTIGRFLPDDSDLPAGFAAFNQFSYRVPDGISANGGMDMAASIAINGASAGSDLSSAGFLMSMVIKPDDLTALGKTLDQLGSLDDATLQKSIEDSGGSFQGIKITEVHALDASGLGDGAAGISMTMDMSGYIASTGGASVPGLSVMTMHMFVFGRGDYIGGVIRMGFTDTLPAGVDELGLAKVIDSKIQAG